MSKPFTYGSLFSGIGGLDLGFDRAGLTCAYQVETDDYANRVLAKHWPDVVRFRDVRDVGSHNLPYADVIAGGFPCQDISYAGKGAGLDGERSGLWYEFARIVGEMGPRIVVVENVSALLTRGIDAVLGTLASLGFDAQWHCIPAAAVGAPHLRDRVFIIAYARGKQYESAGNEKQRETGKRFPEADLAYATSNRRALRRDGAFSDDAGLGSARSADALRAYADDSRQWWTTEPDVDRVAPRVPYRMDRLRGLGNAVVPQVAQFVAEQFVLPRLREGGIK